MRHLKLWVFSLFLFCGCMDSATVSTDSSALSPSGSGTTSPILGAGTQLNAPPQSPGQLLSQMVLNGVAVIDDHKLDPAIWTANGNCNAQPDAGETVQLAFNIVNNGTLSAGPFAFQMSSDAPTTEVVLPLGMASGGWQAIRPGMNWIQAIPIPRVDPVFDGNPNALDLTNYNNYYSNGLVGVQFTAQAHGTYNFSLVANLLDTAGNAIQSVTFAFGLTVGSVPTASSCPGGIDQVVFP